MATDLVAQLTTGSATAESRLASLYAAGTEDIRTSILNELAVSAADGSPYSLELLLALVTEYRLATIAIERHVRSTTIAEEVEQEVLIAVARSIHRYRGDALFTTWLYALARNTAISEVRRQKSTAVIEEEKEYDTAEQRRLSSLVAERDLIREAVLSLPEVFRDTVLLRDVERLSYSEIAERQGLTINTVRSRISRGRSLLAARLPNQPTG
ncbi:MAG: sigma-70 family RNA polymerase sigma factor [Actinomycetota bacterium]